MKNQEQTLYDTLGISRNANEEEIKTAFRKKAKEFHPDENVGNSENEIQGQREEFERAKNAYDILKDPQKRKKYDDTLPPHVEKIIFSEKDIWYQKNDNFQQDTDIFQEQVNAMKEQRANKQNKATTIKKDNSSQKTNPKQEDPYVDLSDMVNDIFKTFFQQENPLKKELSRINLKITDIEDKIKGIEFRVTSNMQSIDFIKKHIQEGIDKKREQGTRYGNYPFIQKDCVEIENKLKKKFCFFRKRKQKELNRLKEQLHEVELRTEENIQRYEEHEKARITFNEQEIHTDQMQLKNLKENLTILQRRKADIINELNGYKKEETNYKKAGMGK